MLTLIQSLSRPFSLLFTQSAEPPLTTKTTPSSAMLKPQDRFFAPSGNLYPGGPSTWHIVDWDQRRFVSVTMDGSLKRKTQQLNNSKSTWMTSHQIYSKSGFRRRVTCFQHLLIRRTMSPSVHSILLSKQPSTQIKSKLSQGRIWRSWIGWDRW